MLTPWQQRSHRRFARHFQEMLDMSVHRDYGINRWLSFERLSVYIRISRRLLQPPTSRADFAEKLTRVVDIANVSTEDKYQGQGMFTRLVGKVHEMTDMPIYLENTQPEFANHLAKNHGWRILKDNLGFSYDLVHYRTEA